MHGIMSKMPTQRSFYYVLFPLIGFFFFLFVAPVEAAIVARQLETGEPNAASARLIQGLAGDLTGCMSEIYIDAEATVASTTGLRRATLFDGVDFEYSAEVEIGERKIYRFVFDRCIPLTDYATSTLTIEVNSFGGSATTYYGTTTDQYLGGACLFSCGGVADYYFDILGFQVPEPPVLGFGNQFNTRFTDYDVTTARRMRIDVELDVSEVNTELSNRNPTLVTFETAARATTTQLPSFSEDFDNTIDGFQSIFTDSYKTLLVPNTTYDVFVHFDNVGSVFGVSEQPFKETFMYATFSTDASNTPIMESEEIYDNLVAEPETAYQECSVTQVTGCINNSFRFLFIPQTSSLDGYILAGEELQTSFPFAFVYDFSESLNDLYTGELTQSATITVPFGDFGDITLLSAGLLEDVPFTPLIRNILGSLLWLMFMMHMYRRTLKIFSTTSAV